MKFIPVIPAYNPDERLLDIIDEIITNGFEKIIIVDDGSNCKDVFNIIEKNTKCILITNDKNMGKGYAIKRALKYYLDNLIDKYQGLVFMDSDCQHLVKDMIKVGKRTVLDDKFVVGMRTFNTKMTPFRNKCGNRITSCVFKKLYGVYLRDTQSGLRGIPNRLVKLFIDISGDRYEYEINQLIYMVKIKEEIIDEEIETIYLEDSNKGSKYKIIRDSYKIYKLLFKNKNINV